MRTGEMGFECRADQEDLAMLVNAELNVNGEGVWAWSEQQQQQQEPGFCDLNER